MQTFTTEFGGSTEQADKIFSKLDKDGSGDISLAEISQLFRDMDADGKMPLWCLIHINSRVLSSGLLFLQHRELHKQY